MIARYDLLFEHPTFDFFGWAIMAVAQGATSFMTNEKIDDAETIRRLESIILPGAELFGLPIYRGWGGNRCNIPGDCRFRFRHFINWARKRNGQFTRLKSIRPPAAERYTVTIRNSRVDKYRNSDPTLWREFAKEIGAYIIEDYYDRPIHLHERMALYAGAEMNFGVWSGPMWLITLTTYPCVCLNWGVDEPIKIANSGIATGESPPWLLPNQITLWEKATPGSLRKAFNDRPIHPAFPTYPGSHPAAQAQPICDSASAKKNDSG